MRAHANKWLLLSASIATLALLVIAAYRENVARDWRRIQRDYAAALPADQRAAFDIHLRQAYVPALRATDRCISCHVGMAPGEVGIGDGPLTRAHPAVVHDPADFGCVVCHAGQGRATETAAAHGTVTHWPEPMLPTAMAWAGCGTCHTHLAVPNMVQVERGRALVERYDCLSCHSLDGRGGTLRPGSDQQIAAPDLSSVGASGSGSTHGSGSASGSVPNWYEGHLARSREAASGERWKTSFGEIAPDDRRAIASLLASRVGAPGLIEAKAAFHSLGCRGCHKIHGVGGDDGPDLTRVGQKDPGRLDYTHVAGERSLANWLRAHFRAPAEVVPGSLMPELGLRAADIEAMTFYMLSLRRSEYPEAYWPQDRVRAERFGEREFATDGGTLYGTFCAACHGPVGQGMRYPGMAAFPAIGNPDFLAVASDRFLTETIRHGRPGRRMPAWGDAAGGLRAAEIDAIVVELRSLAPGVATPTDSAPYRWVRGDAELGARLYRDDCASCHGATGEGREGPALANRMFLAAATDRYLVETIRRGRTGTSMPAFAASSTTHPLLSDAEIESIVTFVRKWENKP